MADKHKDSAALNCMIQRNIWDVLDAYTKDTGIPKTVVVEKALKGYLRGVITDKNLINRLDD